MSAISNPEPLAGHYAAFVQELQEFFEIHALHHGTPEDITILSQRLSVPGDFTAEMSSMIRSFIFRERGTIPRTDLLDIVAVAIGEARIEDFPQEYLPHLRALYAFLGSIARAPLNQPIPEEPQPDEPQPNEPQPEAPVSWSAPSESLPPLSTLPGSTLPDWPLVEEAPPPSRPPSFPVSSDDQLPSFPTSSSFHIPDAPSAFATASPPDIRPGPGSSPPPQLQPKLQPRRRFRWDWAGATLLFLVTAGWFVHDREVAQTASRISSQPQPASSQNALGPSASVPADSGPAASTEAQSSRAGDTSSALNPTKPSAGLAKPSPAIAAASSRVPAPPSAGLATASAAYQPYASRPSQTAPSGASDTARPTPGNQGVRHTASPGLHPTQTSSTPQNQPSAEFVATLSPELSASSSAPSSPAASSGARSRIPHRTGQVGSYGVSSGVMAANLISAPEPEYPKLARLTRTEGQVMLQAVVGRDGRVTIAHVLSGHHLLRGAAVNAVRQWRYRPYVVDGKPVDVATIITVNFNLH